MESGTLTNNAPFLSKDEEKNLRKLQKDNYRCSELSPIRKEEAEVIEKTHRKKKDRSKI